MPTTPIDRLFKIAQYRNTFIGHVGLYHCRKVLIALIIGSMSGIVREITETGEVTCSNKEEFFTSG